MSEKLWNILGLLFFYASVKRLNYHFAKAFTCAHNIRGVNRLVRADEDKTLAAVLG